MIDLPPGTTADIIHRFIYDNWEEIAILAYSQYLKQGRGIVAWLWDLKAESQQNNFIYLPEEILVKIYDETFLTKIKNYNPEETVIIGVIWQMDRENTYFIQFKKDPSPAKLYMMPQVVNIIF